MPIPRISALYRYPVKGLSSERMATVGLTVGEPMPFDRMYAIENGPGAFDEAAPRHLPKVTFLCLMSNEQLATFSTVFEPGLHTLAISRGGHILAAGDLRTTEGRAAIETFIARELAGSLRGRPRVVAAPGHSFSDVREKCLHIINLASVRALEQAMGRAPSRDGSAYRTIDPLRFRANVLVEGLEPWAELDLTGRELSLGEAQISVFKRTVRCAATNVDPSTGARDADVPDALWRTLGHRDFGVYAMVTRGGRVREGDVLSRK